MKNQRGHARPVAPVIFFFFSLENIFHLKKENMLCRSTLDGLSLFPVKLKEKVIKLSFK